MVKLKEFFSLKRPLFLFLMLPYLVLFYLRIINYGDTTLALKIKILLLIIILSDYFFDKFFKYLLKYKFFFAILYSILILFFYWSYILQLFFFINEQSYKIHLRARYILPEILVLLVFIIYKFNKSIFYVKNVFFITLSIILILNYIQLQNDNNKNHPLKLQIKPNKPVVLIILDEYSSNNELYKQIKDSSLFNFKNYLVGNNWIIKDDIYSYDTLTINSLASMFNFNYQLTDKQVSIYQSKEYLKESSLYDSLQNKSVIFYNYGIFDIGNSRAKSKIYYYENEIKNINLILEFFSITLLNPLLHQKTITNNKQIIHNRDIIEIDVNKLNSVQKKSFIYLHLLMPHAPYEFYGKFNYNLDKSSNDEFTKYYNYWKFTNKIIEPFLTMLIKENKFKIILTGDHGLRGYSKIKPNKTFTAYYGFEQSTVDSIKSVQDLGSLINSCY